jgi:creatinine amidohydrolase
MTNVCDPPFTGRGAFDWGSPAARSGRVQNERLDYSLPETESSKEKPKSISFSGYGISAESCTLAMFRHLFHRGFPYMSASHEQRILLHKHSRREFRQRMQSGELKACIIPVAATEQHLEHLSMEHDWRSVMHIACEAASRMQPAVIVAPAMNIGISEHHMQHIGTLSALPGSWLGVLFDVIRSMHHAGFNQIIVLNGHGGNVAPCLGNWGQFQQRLAFSSPHPAAKIPASQSGQERQPNLHFVSYWDLLPKEIAEATLKTKRWPGHAQEFETAFALAAFPENVRHDAMRDQLDQEPLAATAETGQKLIDAIVVEVARYIQGMIDGKNVAPVPEFHP